MSPNDFDVLVVGGGVAGLTTASALAAEGLTVHLVERGPGLGGHAAGWACMATDECARCSACLVEDELHRVIAHPRVEVSLGAQIARVAEVGNRRRITLAPSGIAPQAHAPLANRLLTGERELSVACVVLATGFEVYDPGADPLLGYGRNEGVVTLSDIDHALRRDRLEEIVPLLDRPARIGFVQCVGSRDRTSGRGYCSQFCCRATIRLANRLLYLRPELEVTVFFIDLQIMSKEFGVFYERACDRVQFVQGVPAEVLPGGQDGSLRVFSVAPGEDTARAFDFDRIVLATGLAPTGSHRDLGASFGIELDEFGYFDPASADQRGGLFLAGACSGPTDIQGSRRQALAAAGRVAAWLGKRAPTTRRRGGADIQAVRREGDHHAP